MNEDVLKAITTLLAIISRQDNGTSEMERAFMADYFNSQLPKETVSEYMEMFDELTESDATKTSGEKRPGNVQDPVKLLSICKKINRSLSQSQKVIAVIKVLEMAAIDPPVTSSKLQLIDTICEVFNIGEKELDNIKEFVFSFKPAEGEFIQMIKRTSKPGDEPGICLLQIPSVSLYFLRNISGTVCQLNGFPISSGSIHSFNPGSILRLPAGAPLYFSEIISIFKHERESLNISFNADHLNYAFPNGTIGLSDINISESSGKLIGIMGASGSGKTTLLNVLAGIEKPSSGKILLNGIDIHNRPKDVEGVLGYISQDDILHEDLTVFQNLYFFAKLCFSDRDNASIQSLVLETLTDLGLYGVKDLKVGSILDKKISGGQRKRLNIAMELIREPSVLFVDEPTSGLSSHDSENVIGLLRELSLKGKLIFVVIHQPSSDIYKMFDKMYIMDEGGYIIFDGYPVEAVAYFKRLSHQVDSERAQCQACGNINPEQIFKIIEARTVNEFGQYLAARKVNPLVWTDLWLQHKEQNRLPDLKEPPPVSVKIPGKLQQCLIFIRRDVLSKMSNLQYMLVTFLEAPFLAFLLAFIIRHNNSTENAYLYRYNDNLPAFMLIAVIVALFLGLTLSAEEIIRDRKILKREALLNLSRTSYLLSKVIILFSISAVQSICFVLVGNMILGIEGMTFTYWFALFSAACVSNMMGMNISSGLNSVVTIYIIIPLLLIPQMILSGGIFNFDKLNRIISAPGKVPILADFWASRWAFESIAVVQYRDNAYRKPVFELEKADSKANFIHLYIIPELRARLESVRLNLRSKDAVKLKKAESDWQLLKNEIPGIQLQNLKLTIDIKNMKVESLTNEDLNQIFAFLKLANYRYGYIVNTIAMKTDEQIASLEARHPGIVNQLKDTYDNESLADLVRNIAVRKRIEVYKNRIIKHLDPIYTDPSPSHLFDYRAHFYAPQKYFAGKFYDTFVFNLTIIWAMCILLYVTLYFDVLRKIIVRFSTTSFKK